MKKLSILLLLVLVSINLSASRNHPETIFPAGNSKWTARLLNLTQINGGIGLGDVNADFARKYLGVSTVLGYRITKSLYAGPGAGYQIYNGGTLLPLYLDLGYFVHIKNMVLSPYVDGGWLLPVSGAGEDNIKFLNPGIGIIYPLKNKINLNLAIGLFSQGKPGASHDSFMSVKLGLVFADIRK